MSDTLQGYGNRGSIVLGDSQMSATGSFFCIQFIVDGSFSELVGNLENIQDIVDIEFKKGEQVFGIFSKVTLDQGLAIVYRS